MKYPDLTGGKCAEIGVDLFYMDPSHYTVWTAQHLRPICEACPVQRDCLEWALHHEEFGWWGGTGPRERYRLRKDLGIKLKTLPTSAWLGGVA